MLNQTVTISKDNNHLRQKKWLVRWYSDFDPKIGKARRFSKSFSRRIDAENYKQEKEREFACGMTRDSQNTTMREYQDQFINIRRKALRQKSLDIYEDTFVLLQAYFGPDSNIRNIDRIEAERFISNIELSHKDHIGKGKQLSDSTRNKYIKTCKTIFHTAQEWGLIRINPFQGIKITKAKKKPWHYITPTEFKNILDAVPLITKNGEAPKENIRIKALYCVCYGCGLRMGEVANIIAEQNLNIPNKRINLINRPGTKDIPPFFIKTHEERSIPIPNWVIDVLQKLLEEDDPSVPLLFLTKDRWEEVKKKWYKYRTQGKSQEWINDYLINNTLRNFKVHCRRAGIVTTESLTIHGLRKAYGTNLANFCTPFQTHKKLMGHSSIQTTLEYYTKNTDANELKAVEDLNRMMEEG